MNAQAPITNVNLGGSPRLTLHIEADTLPELMSAINAVMGGLDPSRTEFVGFDEAMDATSGTGTVSATLHSHAHPINADAADAPKRGRGRPPKAQAEAPAESPAQAEPPIAQQPFVPPADPLAAAMAAPAPTPAPAQPAPDATMSALSPADARKKGIEMVQAHFAANPSCLPAIQAVSQKYGVSQFADIPDAEAHHFLADITLLTNGTGQV